MPSAFRLTPLSGWRWQQIRWLCLLVNNFSNRGRHVADNGGYRAKTTEPAWCRDTGRSSADAHARRFVNFYRREVARLEEIPFNYRALLVRLSGLWNILFFLVSGRVKSELEAAGFRAFLEICFRWHAARGLILNTLNRSRGCFFFSYFSLRTVF